MKQPRRTMTTFAVGVWMLNAVLLGMAGIWYRAWLLVPALVCVLGAVGTVVLWRRYRRRMAELATLVEIRKVEMRREVESLRDLLHTHHVQS